ncbi:MAG: PVC-type heme-binding CxxCH protein [Phycisphaeraceae bacterium]
MLPRHAFIIALFALGAPAFAQGLNRTPAPGTYNKPDATAKAMTLPEGFRVNVFAGEPDLVQPIAYAIDARGRLWVIENLSYPEWKKEGNDRIVILEDTDGDGKFDTKKLFWDKGNFATGIQVGFGGVYVGSPPNLLFIPDKDGDDKPDGEAEILLDGWGWHDTHETLNSFIWGPDGWLYGCQGVFTHSKPAKPGTPDKDRTPVNAAIWRWHPTKKIFEVFAEGGSNQWGVDFNDHGQAFMTACVIPHLFHIIQGGRYHRQGGQHNNPNTYADLKTIRTHNHFAAAFAGCMIYLGDQFPDQYRNQCFMNNIHASKVHVDWLERKGSGFAAKFGPHDRPAKDGDRGAGFLDNGDKWVRGLYLTTGPDGGVYLNDWYDQRPCHQLRPHDQDMEFKTGRIYKITYGKPEPVKNIDLSKASEEELVKLQTHKNDWWVRQARRVLQERAGSGKDMTKAMARLVERLAVEKETPKVLRLMWALHAVDGWDVWFKWTQGADDGKHGFLANKDEYIRAWAIQLTCEDGKPGEDALKAFAALAMDDPSPVVRLYLASACQRLPLEQRWAIVEELVKHEADKNDQNLPLLYWYAIEPLVPADKTRALKLAAVSKVPVIREYIARRVATVK